MSQVAVLMIVRDCKCNSTKYCLYFLQSPSHNMKQRRKTCSPQSRNVRRDVTALMTLYARRQGRHFHIYHNMSQVAVLVIICATAGVIRQNTVYISFNFQVTTWNKREKPVVPDPGTSGVTSLHWWRYKRRRQRRHFHIATGGWQRSAGILGCCAVKKNLLFWVNGWSLSLKT